MHHALGPIALAMHHASGPIALAMHHALSPVALAGFRLSRLTSAIESP
jgi:hypothetical protein